MAAWGEGGKCADEQGRTETETETQSHKRARNGSGVSEPSPLGTAQRRRGAERFLSDRCGCGLLLLLFSYNHAIEHNK